MISMEEFQLARRQYRKKPTLKQCPDAMELIRFDTIDLSLIAPIDHEHSNIVRVEVINQHSVQKFKNRIDNGSYDPIDNVPPCVMELTKNSEFYRKGYRYRMVDGHTRREAHVQLGVETMEVAVVRFFPKDGKSANFWRITFMAQRNDEDEDPFHSKPSTPDDKVQAAKSLIAAAKETADNTDEDIATSDRLERISTRTHEIVEMLKITAKSHRDAVYDAVLRAEAANDPDVLKHVVHHYIPYYLNKHIDEFCESKGYDRDNLLVRPFYLKDEMCSRDDYNNFKQLMDVGMDDVEQLKHMAFFGTTADCQNATDVYTARRRKSKLVESMIEYIEKMHAWLSIPKNRKAILSVSQYWLTQTHEEPEIGFIGKINPKTGKMITSKKK